MTGRKKKKRSIDTGYDPEPLRVLHVSTPKSWRGGEQQLAYLYGALEEKGVQGAILCPRGSALESYSQERHWPSIPFARKGPLAICVAWELKRSVASYGPDLLHVHDSHAHTAAYLASLLLGVRIPILVHRRVDFPLRKGFFSRRKFDHPLVKRVIAVSETIRRIGTEGVKVPEKWSVVHSGIDPERFKGAEGKKGELREELGLVEGIPIIGNVAALADHKDQRTFLATTRKFLDQGGKAHFVIIGEGGERPDLEARISELGLEKNVTLMGFRSDVERLLPGFDVFLMSSKTEGLGTSLLDAMAAGVPVISTDAGGIPEIVQDGENGLLAPVSAPETLSEKLFELLNDNGLRDRFIQRGYETVQRFSYKKMGEKVKRIYDSLFEDNA